MGLISILRNKNNKLLFTTPSHGGNLCIMHKFYQWYRNDISEVEAYNPQEALKLAETEAAKIYNTKSTHFLTNGSTSGIIAAVLTCCRKGDKLLIWKNSHTCHKNAAILSGADIVEYELDYNKEWGIYMPLTADMAEYYIIKNKPNALIITSPTYEGMVSDIKSIKSVCEKYNVRLIVDEAHGALYPFSEELPQSAIKYADFTVQSLHKTAGGINPTALLHSNCDLCPDESLNKINTTSPSYPMLATIESNIKFLNSKQGKKHITNLIFNIKFVKSKLTNLEFYGDDVTKILIKKQGISGFKLSEILYNDYNIEDERTNEKSTLLLTGIGTNKSKINSLLKLRKL